MRKKTAWLVLALPILASRAHGQSIGGGTCSNATLSGPYAFTLTGRQVNATGTLVSATQSNGLIKLDGQGTFTLLVSTNTNQGPAQQNFTGTYTLGANCLGTLTTSQGANFTLTAYSSGGNFLISGTDGTSTLAGNGAPQPSSCSVSTLSGAYAINATGFSLSSGAITGVEDLSGLLQFDGAGNLTANINLTSGGTTVNKSGTGQYSIITSCLYTATLPGSTADKTITLRLSVMQTNGQAFDIIGAAQTVMFSGTGHLSFTDSTQTGTATGANEKP